MLSLRSIPRFIKSSSNYNINMAKAYKIPQSYPNCSHFMQLRVSHSKYKEVYNGRKLIGYWFLTCGGMVFSAVILGGVTRLTESGLSMVTWKLLGERMPLSHTDWIGEFEKYKQFPEFKLKNQEMSIEEFQKIWWMEYAHRMWGRLIGVVFFIPAAIFWYQNKFTPALKKRSVVMGSLIAAQGLLGWYMVKSGLENRFDGPNDVPRVSQYRLASHLTLAFVLYGMFIRAGLDQLLPVQPYTIAQKSFTSFKILAHSCKGLIFLTAISGAFVAGLDAGLVYNSFPKMGDQWMPNDIFNLTPIFKNFFENPTTVQFDHRILGIITVTAISALWLLSFKYKLPSRVRISKNLLFVMAYSQVTLGICTLLMYVPVPLAVSHQSGSLILLSLATWLTQELKHIKMLPRI